MSNSINTNIAAYYAQQNITAASNAATSSVARLSSGNAIVQASDNVAGLATGTSLASQVSALKAAQTNASQSADIGRTVDRVAYGIDVIGSTRSSKHTLRQVTD